MPINFNAIKRLDKEDPLNQVGLDLYRQIIEIHIDILSKSILCVYEEFYKTSTGVELERRRRSYVIKDRSESQHRWTDWVTALGEPIMDGANYALMNLIPLEAPSEYPI